MICHCLTKILLLAHSPGSVASLIPAESFSGIVESSKSLPALPKFLLSQSAHSSDSPTRNKLPPFAAEPFPLLPISFVAKGTVSNGSAGSPTTTSLPTSSNPRDDGAIPRDPGRSQGVREFRFRPLSDPTTGRQRALMAFSHGDALHAGILDSGSSHATFLPESLDPHKTRQDVKLSPTVDLVSYLRDGDLFVSTVPTDFSPHVREHRLTFAGLEHPEGGVSCGIGEYVMQEEFGRRTGYWWSPVAAVVSASPVAANGPFEAPTKPKQRHRILYFQIDERRIDGVTLAKPGVGEMFGTSSVGATEKLPYPRAGGNNAICEPKVVEFGLDENGSLESPVIRSLVGDKSLYKLFPWLEYVVRAGWLPDGNAVWFQLLDRKQQRLALVKVPVQMFQTNEETSRDVHADLEVEVLWEEQTTLWINAHDCLKFVEPPLFSSKPIVLAFIFASEKTGFRQLYHVAVHAGWTGARTHVRTASNSSIAPIGPSIVYPHCTIRQLTSGPSIVSANQLVGVDEHRHLIYFHGKRDDPTETQLYACSYAEGQGRIVETVDSRTRVRGFGILSGPHHHHANGHHNHYPVHVEEWEDNVVVLTDIGKSHTVTMNSACTRFVDVSSSVADPPECKIYELLVEVESSELGSPPRRGGGHLPVVQTRSKNDLGTSYEPIHSIRSPSLSESFSFSPRSRTNSRSSATFVVPAIVRPRMPKARLLATLPNPKRPDTMDDHGEMELLEADEDMFRMQLGDHEELRDGHPPTLRADLPPFAPLNDEIIEQDHALSTPLPIMFSFTNSADVTLCGMLYYPDSGPDEGNLPTIARVYGGPNAQVVTNDWKSPQWTRIFLALKLGCVGPRASRGHSIADLFSPFRYCVLIVDNRGSWDRGLAFEGPIQGRLATVEVSDQIEALLYVMCCTTLGEHLDNGNLLDVVRRLGVEWTVGIDSLDSIWARCKAVTSERRKFNGARRLIDPDRIAVTGWSFGGYLSLMMLARHPNIIRVAVAGAPVTQWSLYDTAYTERYLSTPAANPAGYSRSSVLDVAHHLPDEENRLLIVHGAMDENVHITHSMLLVSALIKLNKPHQIQIYPNERHGLRHVSNAEHYDTIFFHFLAKSLRDVVES